MKRLISVLLAACLMLSAAAFAEGNRSLSIEAADAVVYVGKKLTLSADLQRLTDDAPAKTALVWSSSDPSIAKVNGKGVVTGVAVGSATIACQAKDDASLSASVPIEVRASVKALSLSDKRLTLLLGADAEQAQFALTYTLQPGNAHIQTVRWLSSDETVATVDADGIIRAVSPGKAVISAQSDDPALTKAAACAVTVGQAVGGIALAETAVTLEKGKKLRAEAAVSPENAMDQGLVWTSSNEEIARVDQRGTISAKGTGVATIACTAADGSGVSATCEVTVIQKATKVSTKTKRLILFAGKSANASVSVSPADTTNKAVQWSSSDASVASVESGTVTAKRAGNAVITATAADGSGKKCSFKVVVEPANPISLESIGFGRYLPNLLGLTVKNKCKAKTITDFNFDMELYTYNGTAIDSGSYSLGKATKVGAGKTKTIKRNVFGVGYASKVVITITAVQFSDDSYYAIPDALQETWTFTR